MALNLAKISETISNKLHRRRRAEPVPRPDEAKIRLNLGCGDKILAGYINVDIAPSRKGQRPDVISDLRKLDFEDDYADEILSVHVIEHFYHWEVRALLGEWLRVLKPSGKLILECPNLLSAARSLIEDPRRHARPGKDGRTTMWVFYGDPGWKDPLMCHKWGYTPDSLKALLEDLKLTNVQQEPALFKRREPRDMRITGRKPGRGGIFS